MGLIDTHCHLNFPPLSEHVDDVLERASRAGVDRVICPAYDLESWDAVLQLSEMKGVYPALGLHPWAAEEALDVAELKRRLEVGGAVALGEIGLDFKVENVDRQRQVEIFRKQLDLALELDLPVILHCRGAFEEMLEILGKVSAPVRGVVHAFSRGTQLLHRFLDLGLYVGFGGGITRTRAKRPVKSAVAAPLDRILLETDAPSIGLEGVPPEQAEPGNIADIAVKLAELRNESIEIIEKISTRNAERLFRL